MNEQQRAVVQQALDALEVVWREHKAIDGLRQLLEQPEPVQEPVAELMHEPDVEVLRQQMKGRAQFLRDRGEVKTPQLLEIASELVTPPAQPAVPLTDEQANLLINGRGDEGDDDYVEPTGDGFGLTDEDLMKLIRRVEAHHGIGAKP